MFQELANDIRERKCPQCGTQGSLYILIQQAVVQCNRCHKTFIDPFEKGPWEEGVIDTVDEQIVSSYNVELNEAPQEVELNHTWAEFMRFYYERKKATVSEE